MLLQSLDVAIGLAVVYLSVSLVCSSARELYAGIVSLRAKTLKNALDSLLGSTIAKEIIAHPVIPAAQGGTKKPSYIEPALFATALLDVATTNVSQPAAAPGASMQIAHVRNAVNTNPNIVAHPSLQESLNTFLRTASDDYAKMQTLVSNWFDAYMDRISGDYKRQAHIMTAIISVAVVIVLNVDTIDVYRNLTTQSGYAQTIASKASDVLAEEKADKSADSLGAEVDQLHDAIATVPVPLFWPDGEIGKFVKSLTNNWTFFWQKVVGLLITMIAASLGAPFWYDTLSKLANLRSTGAKPEGTTST